MQLTNVALLSVSEDLPFSPHPSAALLDLGLTLHTIQLGKEVSAQPELSQLNGYAALMLPSGTQQAQAVREHKGAQHLIRHAILTRLPVMLLGDDAWVMIANGQLHHQQNRSWRSMGHDLALACHHHLRQRHATHQPHKPLRNHAHAT